MPGFSLLFPAACDIIYGNDRWEGIIYEAAIILPHGVLFRGNAEETIRQKIVDKGLIKAIISLPPNIFYGTSIPASIIVIDKEDADERTGIFMIDASHDFVKDGNKNRLREQDIYKIVTTYKRWTQV